MAYSTTEQQNENARRWRWANPLKAILIVARCRAKRKGMPFTIVETDLLPVPDICPVLGIPIRQGTGKRDANACSIDRIDNAKGYIPGNVEIVSLRANALKSDATPEESMAIAYHQAESLDLLGIKEKEVFLGS